VIGAAIALVIVACWPPPVATPVTVPYREPACTYCAGHRGVGFDVEPGTPVSAVAAGTVTFAGGVAGVQYVVVQQADGLRATYGLLRSVRVVPGQQVAPGEVLALSTARVHFGLRRGQEYLDPTPLLGRWQSSPRLVPTDGSRPRRAPPARLVCRSPG
jgi:murein DD-endopeptidase MepM/ murein hydrolase activator NlpD